MTSSVGRSWWNNVVVGICVLWLILTEAMLHAQMPDPTRFRAELQDGTPLEAAEVLSWHDTRSQPSLASRPLFDANNPARWVLDTSLRTGPLPESFVELTNGDRLPGRVLNSLTGQESPFHREEPQLVVEGRERWSFPSRSAPNPLRVSTRFVKRVVWEARSGEQYQPGTVFMRDGRRLSYQAMRWQGAAVLLLLENSTSEVPIHDIGELHLPATDAWQSYVEQLALLAPTDTSRMIQWETTDGLRVTALLDQLQAKSNGNEQDPNNWWFQLQPAWSQVPLWVSHRKVRIRRSFAPHEPLLTLFDPIRSSRIAGLAGGWSWQRDQNVQHGPLRSGDREYAWGIGTLAQQTLIYPVPTGAQRFRTRVGLDRLAGAGGCAKALIVTGTAEKPVQDATAPVAAVTLIGSAQVTDWQTIPLTGQTELGLISDPFHVGRPAGTDPFEIRDLVNWLHPELFVDPAALKTQIRLASPKLVPAFEGWNLADVAQGPLQLGQRWLEFDRRDSRYALDVRSIGTGVKLSRKQKVLPGMQYLVLAVSRAPVRDSQCLLQVQIDGTAVGEFPVPVRDSVTDPQPILISLEQYQGRTIQIDIHQQDKGPQNAVQWSGLALYDRHPGLLQLSRDEQNWLAELSQGEGQLELDTSEGYAGTASFKLRGGDRGNNLLFGSGFKIREQPVLGEYRYVRFAWRKPKGQPVGLELATDGKWGERNTGNERLTFRYDAGRGDRIYQGARRVDDKLPEEWQVVTRDLVGDWGEFNLTGLSLISPDGEPAWFDSIMLARYQEDFNAIPLVPHPALEARRNQKK